uniref:Secernin 2 n=1 Tax=Petromyzon marinus TaxID=7757 RepID=S4RUP7_PETMA
RTGSPPRSCDTFVALPPATAGGHVVFGKNSDRPSDEVQEVAVLPGATHPPGTKLQCTYIEIEQAEITLPVALSKPAWMWGAEMGANDRGVCVGNEVCACDQTIRDAPDVESLAGPGGSRLALERGGTAREALDVITSLLARYGQGGNCMESTSSFTYHNSFLIADRSEAWVLETAGEYWGTARGIEGTRNISNGLSIGSRVSLEHPKLRSHARDAGWWDGRSSFGFAGTYEEGGGSGGGRFSAGKRLLAKHAGSLSAQDMMSILRDKESGICAQGAFLTTGSMVSILPQNPALPCIHFLTATPDPSRSIFKPFVFVEGVKPVGKVVSPDLGADDPARVVPRFRSKPDRRHELYRAHQQAAKIVAKDEERGVRLLETMMGLERQGIAAMEEVVSGRRAFVASEMVDLFYDCVDTEMKFYK